jgi:hypothetical protein
LNGQSSIEISIDLGSFDQLAVKGLIDTSVGRLRILPKVVELALMGESGHVIDGIAQGFDWLTVIDCRKADGAVNDDHSTRMR